MKIAGLFAGIGGLELGLEATGHESSLLCEIKPEAQAVLKARFPQTQLVADVRGIKAFPRNVDLVVGGFPCQDLSQAGRTNGLAGSNSRLVFEVFRLLEQRRVPWLILENVPFMLQLHEGQAMRQVVSELERLGYRWAYRVVDTFSFGLPQRRERVFVVASRDGFPEDVLLADERPLQRPVANGLLHVAHGFYWTEGTAGLGWAVDAVPTLKNGSTLGIASPPAILLPSGDIIKPDLRDAERLQGFESDWTRPAQDVTRPGHRWSLIGSAVSVPVSRWLGDRLNRPGVFDHARLSPFPETGSLPRAACGDGSGRASVRIGPDPLGIRPPHLATFLKYEGTPLSVKATAGFHRRAKNARLRFAEGFLEAVQSHLERVSAIGC